MIAALLITIREVIEATLIIATILGILTKLGQKRSIKTVWIATFAAIGVSIMLLIAASMLGLQLQTLYSGKTEEAIEGILMMISAVFITWAVFFLHNYFVQQKAHMFTRVQKTIEHKEQRGLFWLAFTAVLREGFEIVLFLSSIFLSTKPVEIFTGFVAGIAGGLLVSFAFFATTLRLPILYAFRTTSFLLILFAAGLLGRGVHEFTEVGWLPELTKVTIVFLPHHSTVIGSIIRTIFGVSSSMDLLQVVAYVWYTTLMLHFIFLRKSAITSSHVHH